MEPNGTCRSPGQRSFGPAPPVRCPLRYGEDVFSLNLEQLVGKLKQLGILNNTLIVVVSDHGEEFWEHGWTSHGHSLYQELTHGVFLMWNPKLIPSPRRIIEPVQLIDVAPTVLDLLGLKIPDVV
jgi:arylsulfatase A-like enzyme